MGPSEHLESVSPFFDRHREDDTLIFVDPAMADNGALYKGFTPEFARAMGTVVCSKADIIDPNITEAAFMLGAEYKEDGTYDEDYSRGLLPSVPRRRFSPA